MENNIPDIIKTIEEESTNEARKKIIEKNDDGTDSIRYLNNIRSTIIINHTDGDFYIKNAAEKHEDAKTQNSDWDDLELWLSEKLNTLEVDNTNDNNQIRDKAVIEQVQKQKVKRLVMNIYEQSEKLKEMMVRDPTIDTLIVQAKENNISISTEIRNYLLNPDVSPYAHLLSSEKEKYIGEDRNNKVVGFIELVEAVTAETDDETSKELFSEFERKPSGLMSLYHSFYNVVAKLLGLQQLELPNLVEDLRVEANALRSVSDNSRVAENSKGFENINVSETHKVITSRESITADAQANIITKVGKVKSVLKKGADKKINDNEDKMVKRVRFQ